MFKKVYNSFLFALNGLKITWREEHNFRIEVIVGIVVLFFIFYFNFTLLESAICIIAMTLVLTSEIINTAIEDLCNKVEPNQDIFIGKVKDTASAFVFISVIGALTLGILVFVNHFL